MTLTAKVTIETRADAPYTHSGCPLTVMRAYRRFLLARKSQWMGQGSGSPQQRRRRVRAHMHYLAYVREYLAAKRACFAVAEKIHDFFINGAGLS